MVWGPLTPRPAACPDPGAARAGVFLWNCRRQMLSYSRYPPTASKLPQGVTMAQSMGFVTYDFAADRERSDLVAHGERVQALDAVVREALGESPGALWVPAGDGGQVAFVSGPGDAVRLIVRLRQ